MRGGGRLHTLVNNGYRKMDKERQRKRAEEEYLKKQAYEKLTPEEKQEILDKEEELNRKGCLITIVGIAILSALKVITG